MRWYRLARDHVYPSSGVSKHFDITVNEYLIDLFSRRGKVTNFMVDKDILKFIPGTN